MPLSHMITLTVGVTQTPEREEMLNLLSGFATEISKDIDYVSVSAVKLDTDEEEVTVESTGCLEEHLYHDDQTLERVRVALRNELFVPNSSISMAVLNAQVVRIINEMQNAGILFRERSRD